jgi:AcrR family transcriptional regulator
MATSTLKHGAEPAAKRILASAATLFARFGYNGVSTRAIATTSGVNEATVYRLFKRKRDLYCKVLESELKKVQLGGELLSFVADAPDARTALERTFTLTPQVLMRDPILLRLIHFCALELDDDIPRLLRKYLAELIEVVAGYRDPWIERGELPQADSRALVVTIAGIICSGPFFGRIVGHEFNQQRQIFGDDSYHFLDPYRKGQPNLGEELKLFANMRGS